MGVHGLWELLAPVGRRVSVETLSGKKLAIDASIWMIQFMKAMRDERGDMVRNAHILGFFRRICKLLFLRTKPIFVFDGGTPALKRRTVAARRRNRENARAKIRKTAEKLLLNHLKSKRLEELAEEIKRSKSEVKEDLKGKQVASVDNGSLGLGKASSYGQSSPAIDKAINQERLDELLAASISAEEEAKLAGNEAVNTKDIKYEEDGEEDEEENMIIPVNSGNIDPAVLASLPPSMQLNLLGQMRERLMADNRQKYQKIKKVPAKFSELQIQSYLTTVAFRREIVEVQKSASGRGVGGLQTSRIASEANREYIFSKSFAGDKQMLTPTAAEKNGGIANQEMRTTASDTPKRKLFMSPSKFTGDMSFDVPTDELPRDVETYFDERGRARVSRDRGLGIRMTRDLQQNLNLMKEHENVSVQKKSYKVPEPISYNDASDIPKSQSQTGSIPIPSLINEKNSHCTCASIATEGVYEEIRRNAEKSTRVSVKEAAIEISFSEDEIGSKTMADNFFMNLVSENPTREFVSESISLEKNKDDFEPEDIWEDGMVGEQNLSLKGDDIQSSFAESKGCEEDEIMCEEGASLVSHSEESENAISLGFLEEEADLKEAIRRSLEDIKLKQSSSAVPVEENMTTIIEAKKTLISVKNDPNIEFPIEMDQVQSVVMDFLEEKGCFGRSNVHQFIASHDKVLSTSIPVGKFDGESTLKDDTNNLAVCNTDVVLSHDIQVMEQSIDQSTQENLCKISSNRAADEPDLGKTDDHVLENHPNIDFEGLSFSKQTSMQEEDKIAASEAILHDEISLLKHERTFLEDEQKKLERNAESVSSETFAECQELLQMFGLPYIIAPMEAEAQCAYMEMNNLVDGIITDDSDVFLFGAQNVYKNIFDDRKYVETYFMKDIENELGLSREKLIRIALLLGSDYTEGVSGIGIVNAIEVINGFPEKDGLLKFKDWVESPDLGILRGYQYDGNSKKSSSNTNGNTADGTETNIVCSSASKSEESVLRGHQSSETTIPDTKKLIFMDKHRNVSKNWHFPPSFPSESVITAYISPQVDESIEPFAWGKPDLPLLRKICLEKFGWPNQKADDLLVPVLKEYNKHETQLRMEAFYSFNERFAKIRSQRIKKAVKGIAGISSSGLTDIVDGGTNSGKKRGINLCNDGQSQVENDADRPIANERKSSKRSRKKAPSRASPRGRGRGRGQGSGISRERGRGKGNRGEHSNEMLTESSDDELHGSNMMAEPILEMRRSNRNRSQVDYAESDAEINELHVPDKPTNGVTVEHDRVALKDGMFGNVAESFNQEKTPHAWLHSRGDFSREENEIQEEELPLPATILRKHSFEQNDGKSQRPLEDDGSGNNFFVTGGGFCMDESDPGMPASAESFQGEINEAKSKLGSSGRGDSSLGEGETVHENLPMLENLGPEQTNGDAAVQNFLCAMPSLKRKRKT